MLIYPAAGYIGIYYKPYSPGRRVNSLGVDTPPYFSAIVSNGDGFCGILLTSFTTEHPYIMSSARTENNVIL